MAIKDISFFISSKETDLGLVDQAVEIAEAWQAHLSCGAIGIQPAPVYAEVFSGTGYELPSVFQATEEAIRSFRTALGKQIERTRGNVELRAIRCYESGLAETVSVFSRYADVTFARMPDHPDTSGHGEIIEGALFGSGRPVLAVPKKWAPRPLGQKVLLAWDASREASRAIHDAMPLLSETAEVFVVTVDARVGPDKHGPHPGLDIAGHLARHGLRATVRNEDSLGKPTGERLAEIAAGNDVDMIIMGGYRHSRLAQRVFGGPSRYLLSNASVPVFLAH